jgi:hypothetical protein
LWQALPATAFVLFAVVALLAAAAVYLFRGELHQQVPR